MTTILHSLHRQKGFSLIEIMITLVVLSTGLLALATLQGTAARNTAQTKNTSAALALAEDRLEQMRTFFYRSSDDACPTDTSEAWPREFRCIAGREKASAEVLADEEGSLGGTTFNRWWTVDRYIFNPDANTFTRVAATTATDTALLLASPALRPGTEVKRVTMHVEWEGGDGRPHSFELSDTISATSPNESARVRTQRKAGAGGPRVVYRDPSTEVGVIPIATGTGSETAATNPRPEVVSQGNNSTIVETRFDVLTYASMSNNLALAQSRVETTMIGCTCDPATTTDPAYRPTYWDGVRYTPPKIAPYNAIARPATGVTQSALCARCCADHHDPSTGVEGARFDPWRNTHEHYRDFGVTLAETGLYQESCRVIRVDGFQQVAQDINSEHFGLIGTANAARSPAPASTAVQGYENFVLAYLDNRFVSGTQYNIIPGNANTLAATMGLDDPATISISRPSSGTDPRWLHARGLYIDYLEPEAVAKLTRSKDECTTQPSNNGCVLPYVPFTAINMTELARWNSANTNILQVTNNTGVVFGDGANPVRGRVSAAGTAVTGNSEDIQVRNGNSNTGLALVPPVDPHDATEATDRQNFVIGDVSGTGFKFTVILDDLPFVSGNFPVLAYSKGSDSQDCSAGASAATPNPYACVTNSSSGGAIDLVIERYNVTTPRLGDNPCTGNKVEDDYAIPYCVTYNVLDVTRDSGPPHGVLSVTNTGRLSERTTARFVNVETDEVLRARFGNRQETAPSGYVCGGPGNRTPTWTLSCQ